MIYEILDSAGTVINRIVAENEFVEALYPGRFREVVVDHLPTEQDYEAALTNLYDQVAQSRHYDSRITCSLRAGYPGPFQAEGIAFAQWMDECNALGYALMAKVLAGEMAPPTVNELLALMPEMAWPA